MTYDYLVNASAPSNNGHVICDPDYLVSVEADAPEEALRSVGTVAADMFFDTYFDHIAAREDVVITNIRAKLSHPLPVGTKIRSVLGAEQGDWDEDDDGTERRARPGEVGTISSADHYDRQGWTYGVVFDECEAWIFLEESEVNDPAHYTVLA